MLKLLNNEIATPIGKFTLLDISDDIAPKVMHREGNDCLLMNKLFYLARFTPEGEGGEEAIVGWIERKSLQFNSFEWVNHPYDMFVPLKTKLYDVSNGHNRNFEK